MMSLVLLFFLSRPEKSGTWEAEKHVISEEAELGAACGPQPFSIICALKTKFLIMPGQVGSKKTKL